MYPNTVFCIKYALNVSRFTVYPDIPCNFPFPDKHGKWGYDCTRFCAKIAKIVILLLFIQKTESRNRCNFEFYTK